MRLITLLIATLILFSCGPDRKTPIEDRGGPGTDDTDPRRKLQASLDDSKLMTSMVMSRFGEVDRLIRALLNFDRPSGNCPSLQLGKAVNKKLKVKIDWTACSGTYLVFSEQEGEITLTEQNKFFSADIILPEGSAAVYRQVGQGTYDIKLHNLMIDPTENPGVYSFSSDFKLERRTTQNKRKWAVISHQEIDGQVAISADNSNPDRPRGSISYSDVIMESKIEQRAIERDTRIYEFSRYELIEEKPIAGACGFLEGSYTLSFRSDRLDSAIEPEKRLIVGSSSFTDPFGATYRYDNCLDDKNNLMFVKTNLESLMRYKVRD